MTGKRSLSIPGFGHRAPIPGAARVGNLLFSSAISGIDPETGQPADDPVRQVELVFTHLQSLMEVAGTSLAHIGKMAVYIRDNAMRDPINEAWLQHFPDPEDRPARHIQLADLPGPLHLQIEVIAIIPEGE